jgi:hypothetical protein
MKMNAQACCGHSVIKSKVFRPAKYSWEQLTYRVGLLIWLGTSWHTLLNAQMTEVPAGQRTYRDSPKWSNIVPA